jgi:membrane protein implicated in regulation of membrane protease activity
MGLATIWLITAVVLMVSEFIVPGFVIVFFGIGALAASGVAQFTEATLVTQGWIFVVVSVLSLLLGRRYCKGLLRGKQEISKGDADDDGVVGRVAVVTAAIEPPRTGSVEVNGVAWKAIAERAIPVGTSVTVVKRDNITLTVE